MFLEVFGEVPVDSEICALVIQVKWGTIGISFYPSHTVKTRGYGGHGGGQRAVFPWILGFKFSFSGISFQVGVGNGYLNEL